MGHPQIEPDDLRLAAAELAFELLLFEQAAAHRHPGHVPDGYPILGEGAFMFLPSTRHVAPADVPAFLAGLPAPAMLATTGSRGVSALLLLNELHGARRAGMEMAIANQEAVLEHVAERLKLTDASVVALEFDDRRRTFSFAVVREWARRYVCMVGWNLDRPRSAERVDARFLLVRSDGGMSTGGLRPPDSD